MVVPMTTTVVSYRLSDDERAALESWLDEQAAAGVHPDDVGEALRRSNVDQSGVEYAKRLYAKRFPQDTLGWTALFWTVGLAAVSGAGLGHALLDGNGGLAATWFTLLVVSAPFAGYCTWWSGSKLVDPLRRYSRARRYWASTLFGLTVLTIVVRAAQYGNALGSAWFDDGAAPGRAIGHLVLTLTIGAPIAVWSWFRHIGPCLRRPIPDGA
jgi:hypothetical protein